MRARTQRRGRLGWRHLLLHSRFGGARPVCTRESVLAYWPHSGESGRSSAVQRRHSPVRVRWVARVPEEMRKECWSSMRTTHAISAVMVDGMSSRQAIAVKEPHSGVTWVPDTVAQPDGQVSATGGQSRSAQPAKTARARRPEGFISTSLLGPECRRLRPVAQGLLRAAGAGRSRRSVRVLRFRCGRGPGDGEQVQKRSARWEVGRVLSGC